MKMKNAVASSKNMHQVDIRFIVAWFLVIFLSSCILYMPSHENLFAYDDQALIIDNTFFTHSPTVQKIFTTNYRYGAGNTRDGLYRPLVILSYLMNASGNSLNPAHFHVINTLLHALCSTLFFVLIFSLSKNIFIAVTAALIFAFHPLHTEAVVNIAGRPELLCCLFLFTAWLCNEMYLNYILKLVAMSLFFALALLSKETAVVFPFLIMGIDLILDKKVKRPQKIAQYFLLFFILGLYFLLRWSVLGETVTGNVPMFYNNPIANSSPLQRISTALGVLGQYFRLILFPFHLSSDYSYNAIHLYDTLLHPVPLLMIIMISLLLIAVLRLRKRMPLIALSVLLFILPYILISNILFPIGTIMGERLMYIPLAGFALFAAFIFHIFYKRKRFLSCTILSLVLVIYSVVTVKRSKEWHDNYTLTCSDVKKQPESIKLLHNMGIEYANLQQYAEAERYYQKALRIYPEFGECYMSLGKLMYDQGKNNESIAYYEKALELRDSTVSLWFDLASVYSAAGRTCDAINLLREGIEKYPGTALFFRGIGNAYLADENYSKALTEYQSAYRLGGSRRILLNNMALACYLAGNYSEAKKYVDMATLQGISLHPQMVQSIREKTPDN